FDADLLPSARCAGSDGALRAYADDGRKLLCQLGAAQERMARRASKWEGKHWSFCYLRAAQERMARRASQLEGRFMKALPLARCAPSLFITRDAQNKWRVREREIYILKSHFQI
ncbi:hypothetical protein A2U01_0054972, partial [Trifolium medium]|nr:hypothetical protein [Trifolium medium]